MAGKTAMFSFDKKEIVKSGKFLLALIAVFLLLSFVFWLLGELWVELFTAHVAATVLGALGVEPVVSVLDGNVLIGIGETIFQISYLCTGLFELIILVSAIAASFGISLRKRGVGILGAVIFGFVFNQMRIVVSVLLAINTNIRTAELAHDVFFRLTLFIVIAGYYAAWFWFATKKR